MLVLVNSNRMSPPIAPIGLDYVATAARRAGIDVRLIDPCLAQDPDRCLSEGLRALQPTLVGITFRNVDDCFWPSATWFVPELSRLIARVRGLTGAPIVLGGVGFSVFAARVVEASGADFGVRGDGEIAVVRLHQALASKNGLDDVPGLIRREGGRLVENAPAWGEVLSVPTCRDVVDNAQYFRRGGQGGIETKRGCPRSCVYCADPLAKGPRARLRDPSEVADEVDALAGQGVDVLHVCDGEFNVPRAHALAVCQELARRGAGERVRLYAYAAVTPFDRELALAMRRAGFVGVDFTGDSGSDAMLARYGHLHRSADVASAVALCKEMGITCMVDLLLGGPGETDETLSESIALLRRVGPDAVGAALGMRLYPGTPAHDLVRREGPLESCRSIRRKYEGPVDLLRPTFYISSSLGDRPAARVRELIGDDRRFFPPADDEHSSGDHNYNDNAALVRAIEAGARGAYWDILRAL